MVGRVVGILVLGLFVGVLVEGRPVGTRVGGIDGLLVLDLVGAELGLWEGLPEVGRGVGLFVGGVGFLVDGGLVGCLLVGGWDGLDVEGCNVVGFTVGLGVGWPDVGRFVGRGVGFLVVGEFVGRCDVGVDVVGCNDVGCWDVGLGVGCDVVGLEVDAGVGLLLDWIVGLEEVGVRVMGLKVGRRVGWPDVGSCDVGLDVACVVVGFDVVGR